MGIGDFMPWNVWDNAVDFLTKSDPGKTKTEYGSTATTSFDNTNPYILEALKRLQQYSQQGISPQVLQNMQRLTKERIGKEGSGMRTSTAQRLMRQDVPIQMQSQIMRDMSTGMLGEQEQALGNIAWQNELMKLQALQQYGSLSKGLMGTSTTKSKGWGNQKETQPGGGLGSLLAIAAMYGGGGA